jgi:Glycosyl transferase family 11
MVIVRIMGGLGNQMFQFAAGYALARRHRVPLLLDISSYQSYGLHHGFELSRIFSMEALIAQPNDIKSALGWQGHPYVYRPLRSRYFSKLRKHGWIVEPHLHFWPSFFDTPDTCYLDGYWQSEKYFANVQTTIREVFNFSALMTDQNNQTADVIENTNAVSLHVRRGDYATNPKTLAFLGLCTLAYYQTAIQHIQEHVSNPIFFVFSDDIAWCKDNLNLPSTCHYINHNSGNSSYLDMQLMSLCKHHVVSNSTFSWWGAWLSGSTDGIKIAPTPWFSHPDVSDESMVPSNWLKLPK